MATAEEDAADETDTRPDSLEVIAQADRITKTVEIIDAIAHESVLRFGSDGIDVRVVDPANVAMTDLDLAPGAFEHVGSGTFPAGINHETLQDLLDLADSDGLVQLAFDEETRKMHVEFGRIDRDVALIDPDSIRARPDIPPIYDDLPNTVEVPAEYLTEAVESARLVSDHVYIEADMDAESVAIRAEGDIDDTAYTFHDDDYEYADIREAATSIVSLEYLEDLIGVVPKDAVVELTFGDDFPIFLEWGYADGDGVVQQMLAPRIKSD